MLVQNGYEVEERDYFKEPFSETELRDLVAELGEPGVTGMGLNAAELSDERKIALMLEEPRLVRRPIVRLGDRLIVGASVKAMTEALGS